MSEVDAVVSLQRLMSKLYLASLIIMNMRYGACCLPVGI